MASASKLAHLPVGSGLRSSFSGRVVTVFGGTGLAGRLIVNRMGRDGTQIVAPTRGDDYFAKDLKVCGDLGQVHIRPFHLANEESIHDAVKYSDTVINAMGKTYTRYLARQSMTDVNVAGAERLARISKAAGVERFVQVSALDVRPDHPSQFIRSQHAAEQAVRSAFPDSTIVRTATPIHQYDRFLRFLHVSMRAMYGGKFVVRGKANLPQKYPVAYPDLARAVCVAATKADAVGKTYELLGPDRLSIADMYDLLFASKFRLHKLFHVPESLVTLWGLHHELFGVRVPLITRDEITRFYSPDVLTPGGLPGFEELGITPQSAEFIIIDSMRMYRKDMFANMSYEDVQEQRS